MGPFDAPSFSQILSSLGIAIPKDYSISTLRSTVATVAFDSPIVVRTAQGKISLILSCVNRFKGFFYALSSPAFIARHRRSVHSVSPRAAFIRKAQRQICEIWREIFTSQNLSNILIFLPNLPLAADDGGGGTKLVHSFRTATHLSTRIIYAVHSQGPRHGRSQLAPGRD